MLNINSIHAIRTDRFHLDDRPSDQRTQFQRDRDRILYTSAFRRLAGITQVVSPTESQVIHNRLTHTLEVAQIGRRIAEKLLQDASETDRPELEQVLSPDVVEASALAHDLGHPPLGHITEQELNNLVRDQAVPDGFDGNAQSFRIVTQLAIRNELFLGLNLTRATLNALLKYPWMQRGDPDPEPKWGAYTTESTMFEWTRSGYGVNDKRRSLEAEIMDWSDDIAYAVHDVEDFTRAGVIPLHRLLKDQRERDRFFADASPELKKSGVLDEDIEAFSRDVPELFPLLDAYDGSRSHRAALRRLTASLIARYVMETRVALTATGASLNIPDRHRAEVAILKQLTWYYVIENPALAVQQHGLRAVVRGLFEIYLNANRPKGQLGIFPIDTQRQLNEADGSNSLVMRIIADHIASMTEEQVITTYQRLTGVFPGRVPPAYFQGA